MVLYKKKKNLSLVTVWHSVRQISQPQLPCYKIIMSSSSCADNIYTPWENNRPLSDAERFEEAKGQHSALTTSRAVTSWGQGQGAKWAMKRQGTLTGTEMDYRLSMPVTPQKQRNFKIHQIRIISCVSVFSLFKYSFMLFERQRDG